MGPCADTILALSRRLTLTTRVLTDWVDNATGDQLDLLAGLLTAEVASRQASHLARLLKKARLPQHKTLDGYRWETITLPTGLTRNQITGLEFIDRCEDLICIGDVGTGETRLALALARTACLAGIGTRFYTVSSLVMALRRAKSEDRLDKLLAELSRPRLLILDELGYLPIDADGGRLLFQVTIQAYEHQGLIITTNLDLSAWGTILGDDNLAAAIIDRLVHHGRLLRFTGSSYRPARTLLHADEAAGNHDKTTGISLTKHKQIRVTPWAKDCRQAGRNADGCRESRHRRPKAFMVEARSAE